MVATLAYAANAVPSKGTSSTSNSSTSTSKSAQAQQTLAGNMNTFLKLLTSQLQHQDPLSPMDTTQFTNQLVQFSSVEQQINTNSNLEKLLASQRSSEMASAVNYLGSKVQGVGTQLPLQNGAASFSYTTPANMSKVTATISDSAGNIVKTVSLNNVAGTYSYNWDGTNSYGTKQADGNFKITINGSGTDGTNTQIDAAVVGTVTGLGMDSNNNVILYLGNQTMNLKDVLKVVAGSNGTSTGTSGSSGSSGSSGTKPAS